MSSTRFKREPKKGEEVKKVEPKKVEEVKKPQEVKKEEKKPQEVKKEDSKSVSTEKKSFVIRLRGKDGNFKYEGDKDDPIENLKKFIEKETSVPAKKVVLSTYSDPNISRHFITSKDSIEKSGLKHGDMIYFSYDSNFKSKQEQEDENQRKEKNKVMEKMKNGEILSLTELKMVDGTVQWTQEKYDQYLEQFRITVNPIPFTQCTKVSIDELSQVFYGNLLLQYDFTFQRCGYLIGQVKDSERRKDKKDEKEVSEEEKKAKYYEILSYAIYEPPQEGDEKNVFEWEDEIGKKIDNINSYLGMKKVGYIFSHARIGDKLLKNEEVLKMAKLQNQFGEHFVTIVATPTKDKTVSFEAYQASPLCCELVKKDILMIDPKNPINMKTKRPLIFKGTQKENFDVELTFLYKAVSITFVREEIFKVGFPPRNRPSFVDPQPNYEILKNVLLNRKKQKLPFVKRITDYHLLIYISDNVLDDKETKTVCEAVRTQNNSLAQGFEYVLNSAAGIDY